MTEKITKLGKYTLGEQLGSGGFGTVFKASDSIGRTVAIKLLKPGWTDDPATIERFRREAQVAGELFHTRIATIIDFDEQDGRLFLVMRYVDGQPLDKLLKEKGRLGWAETIQILEQVAEGLDYAHQRGFTHRDIKPANILISDKDGAVLTDFGLVKAADVSGMSTSGVMLGTPHYIAPEIWQGQPVGPAADIYSLACVACEMLTGQVLFAGVSPPEIMTRHMRGAPELPKEWPQGVPAGISEVLLRALDQDPGKRPASALAFVLDLKKQEAGLRREAEAQAQALLQNVEALIKDGKLAQAREALSQAAALAADLPLIPELTKKLERSTQLNQVYAEAADHYRQAQEKAQTVLKGNPAHPDPENIFQKLGLRGSPATGGSTPPETGSLRWQEKCMPYALVALGLATAILGVGLIGSR